MANTAHKACSCGLSIHDTIPGDKCARCLGMPDSEIRQVVEKLESLYGSSGNRSFTVYSYLAAFKKSIEGRAYPKEAVDSLVSAAKGMPQCIPHRDDCTNPNVHIDPATVFVFSRAIAELEQAILPRFRVYGRYWKDLDHEAIFDEVITAIDEKSALAIARGNVEGMNGGLAHNLEVAWKEDSED